MRLNLFTSFIVTLLTSLLFTTAMAGLEEKMHAGHKYDTIKVVVDPAIKDAHTMEQIKTYAIPGQIKDFIRINFDGKGKASASHTITITINKFRFRTGKYFGSGKASQDILRAKVEVTGTEAGSKEFTVTTRLDKGLTKKSRAKRLAKSLAQSIVDSL